MSVRFVIEAMSERVSRRVETPDESGVAARIESALKWVSLIALAAMAIGACRWLPPWLQMWTLAVAIYAGFKWATVPSRVFYLLFWPGMNARVFLDTRRVAGPPDMAEWVWALAKAGCGAGVLWGVARSAGNGLLAGWIGMLGLIFLLLCRRPPFSHGYVFCAGRDILGGIGLVSAEMKIVIPGGTGHVGRILARAFREDGHEVVVLSRVPRSAPWRVVKWDACSLGDWVAELEGADAVINLAGRSVNCRYTPENRRMIKESRVRSTKVVGEALVRAKSPPRVWLQASTATIYAHRYDRANDEAHGLIGGSESNAPDTWRFSIDVATAWEREAERACPLPHIRMVLLRSAIIMAPDEGGPFDMLLRLVRYGLGGRSGNGRQYVSWIHDRDFIRAIDLLLGDDGISGAVNLAAPNPLPNAEFMRDLRKAWGIPFGLPASKWMLEIGALVLRTETELILKSRRVIPSLLTQRGFSFQFPTWPEAALDLCKRWAEAHGTELIGRRRRARR
jgi:uncharacterized protein (TIGR01777 family)